MQQIAKLDPAKSGTHLYADARAPRSDGPLGGDLVEKVEIWGCPIFPLEEQMMEVLDVWLQQKPSMGWAISQPA